MKNKNHIAEDIAAVLILILAVSLILLFLLSEYILLGNILMVIATVSFLTVCGIITLNQ